MRYFISHFKKVLENITENHPSFCVANILLGHSCYASGETAQAVDYYQAVLSSPHADDEQRKDAKEYLEYCLKDQTQH